MTEQIEIIAYHGWGFDHSCWQEWRILLQSYGIKFQSSDRGYFGHPKYPIFGEDSNSSDSDSAHYQKIIFAHSYGLHLCPIEQLQAADALVIFSSFQCFHPDRESVKRRSIAMLNQMKQQFSLHPDAVLNNFKTKCYYPVPWQPSCSPPINGAINLDLLMQDLEALGSSCWNLCELNKTSSVMILHGSSDRIVAPSQGQALCEQLKTHHPSIEVQSIEIQPAGHALPFTHLQDCWSFIRSVILP